MTWGKVSDDLHSHPKWTGCSPNAKALWVTALSYCSGYLTDGRVERGAHLPTLAVETFGLRPSAGKTAEKAAAELVECGLWKQTATGWRFHDWKDNNPTAASVRRRKGNDRWRQWLHKSTEGKALKRQIRARDGDLCSWCGEPVRWGANKAPDGGTYDHVDAGGPRDAAWNIVVSCNACNGTKSDLDHDEIGFELREGHQLAARWLPAASRATADPSASTRPNRDSIAIQFHRTTEAGAGRVGIGSDSGRDGAPPDQGLVGSVGHPEGVPLVDYPPPPECPPFDDEGIES